MSEHLARIASDIFSDAMKGAIDMKALRVHDFASMDSWQLESMDAPKPQAGEVLIRVAASAITYVDRLFARGGYQVKPPLPLIPGTELTGTVVSCGPAVSAAMYPGRKVCGTVFGGAWATHVCASESTIVPIADDADLLPASVLPITYATAMYALKIRGHLKSGEQVLVLGGAGGVGAAAIQIGKILGANVIGLATGARKLEIMKRLGADIVIDAASEHWRSEVKAVAPKGIDVVVDPVGGSFTEQAFKSIKFDGRHLIVGFANDTIPSIRTNLPLLKSASIIGVDIRQFREVAPIAAKNNLADVVDIYEQGLLKPPIAHAFTPAMWASAIAASENRAIEGRVIFDWRDIE